MEEITKTKAEMLQEDIDYMIKSNWADRNFLSSVDHVRNRYLDKKEEMPAELLADIEAARLSIRTYEPLIEELRKEIVDDSSD